MAVRPRQSRHFRYEPPSRRGQGALEIWAENGLIIIVDERFPPDNPKALDCLTVREFLQNLQGINASIGRIADHNSTVSVNIKGGSAGGSVAEERESLHKLVENGIIICKVANQQGRPDDPRHLEQIVRDRRKSMVHGGAKAEGAISADVAPEGGLLPRLWIPGTN